jgi:hypothetical protein
MTDPGRSIAPLRVLCVISELFFGLFVAHIEQQADQAQQNNRVNNNSRPGIKVVDDGLHGRCLRLCWVLGPVQPRPCRPAATNDRP